MIYTVPADEINKLKMDRSLDPVVAQQEAVLNGFVIRNGDELCVQSTVNTRSLEAIGSLQFEYLLRCGGLVRALYIEYDLLFDHDKSHRNFVRLSVLRNTQNITLTNHNRTHRLDVEAIVLAMAEQKTSGSIPVSNGLASNRHYFTVGLEHILTGFDHLLFLVVLILLPLSLRHVLYFVTAFTLAHSITLALSVLEVVSLSPVLVELAIALSIVFVAVESIYILRSKEAGLLPSPVIRKRLVLTFLFGLIHGFGFSFLLKTLGLGKNLFASLLFFNLGVEAGQLMVIAVILPLVYYLFKSLSNTLWAQVAAGVAALVGALWFMERLAGVYG